MIKEIKIDGLDNVELMRKDSSKHEYPKHYHEPFCISFIKSGTLTESDLILPTKAIWISHPFEVHYNELFQNIEYSFTTFYVSSDVFCSINKSEYCSFEEKVIYDDSLFASFDNLAKQVMSEDGKVINKDNFLQNLYSNLELLTHKYSSPKPYQNSTKPELIDEIKNHILLNLDNKISLEKLANKVGMSKFKFIRWFKKHVGLTPFDFIILNRVLSGQKMLREGKPPLDTAMDTGFYDQSHFSNYFKRFIGVTPKRYQDNCNIFQYS